MRNAVRRLSTTVVLTALLAVALFPSRASAQGLERMCDPGWEDCRAVLINYIRAEKVGLDVAFWFMEDSWIAAEVIARHQAGVPVRVLMDTEANASNPRNAERLNELRAAGVPMRERVASGILHWKMMLFAGQGIVEFSGANYSSDAWLYSGAPGTNYVDEAIYFTNDSDVVNSFRTKYDDLWTNTAQYANYANISGPLMRRYSTFAQDPELNFPPLESFFSRSSPFYDAEATKIDATIYRITDQRHTNALIAARQRGIPVRMITEPQQYRDPTRLWHSWNVDRLYMAGVSIRNRAHAGLTHQKTTLLYSQRVAITGSSNWTSPSDSSQEEHNYLTRKPELFSWLVTQFERKWNNSNGVAETAPFSPLPPDAPLTPSPASASAEISTTGVILKWHAGYWAHRYDIYFGTTENPPLLVANVDLGPSTSASDYKQYALPMTLNPGTRYFWKVVSKTMADRTAAGQVWYFTTAGASQPPPPPPPPPPGGTDIVLYASKATTRVGAWALESDATAAGGARLRNPDLGAAKLSTASASPANYFELTFTAEAGRPYRLWLRGRADNNHWGNDSTFVQFSGSVDVSGNALWRIGTTSATEVSLEECSGCGVSNWGWQDNGWGPGVLGPDVYFATTGAQRVRIQTREDGMAIDQIVLSPSTYFSTAPGANKNDATILPEQTGGAPPPTDTTAPTATIASPSNGATVSGTASVSVTATDNVGVARVEMLLDGALVATDTAAPFSFSWDTTTAANGSHTLRARAVDAAGNSGLSATITVNVSNGAPADTQPPTAAITSPKNGRTVSGTVGVAVNTSDNVGVTRVELFVDGALYATDTTAPYTLNWNTAAFINGSHTLHARAFDAAGNSGLSSTITVNVSNAGAGDTTPPTVTLTSPANGATVSGSIAVAASATDNVAVNRVEFIVDGTLRSTDTTAPYAFTWDTTTVANGSRTVTARAYDAAGNNASRSATVTVNNTAPPSSEIVLWTSGVTTKAGGWQVVSDATAAGGATIWNPDGGLPKLTTALASPANYFEITFTAQAGQPYRIWLRGRADGDYYANDSVFLQFDNSVTSTGAAQWRIGTTSAAEYNLEECSGCGISGWGWQDNGWGVGVMGPLVYFSTTGTQRLRIQTREDGLRIDQIVLSPAMYLNTAPGPSKNATNVVPKTQ